MGPVMPACESATFLVAVMGVHDYENPGHEVISHGSCSRWSQALIFEVSVQVLKHMEEMRSNCPGSDPDPALAEVSGGVRTR